MHASMIACVVAGALSFCPSQRRQVVTGQRNCDLENIKEALDVIGRQNFNVHADTYARFLEACAKLQVLCQGRRVHAHLVKIGCERNIFVGNCLIDMYRKCGSVDEAKQEFDIMGNKNIFSWTIMMAAYAQFGYCWHALGLFQQMQHEGMMPNVVSLVTVLNACDNVDALAHGKLIHAHFFFGRFGQDVVVATALLNMYGKCGNLDEARRLFDSMSQRNVISWTAMITAYSKNFYGIEAIKIFQLMKEFNQMPNEITLMRILDACCSSFSGAHGKFIHSTTIEVGIQPDRQLGTALVRMYGECGIVDYARDAFDITQERDAVSWTAIIAAHSKQTCIMEALKLFRHMELEGTKPDKIAYISIFHACTDVLALEMGKLLHASVVLKEFEEDIVIQSSLINMYGKCGSIIDVHRMLNNCQGHDIVLSTTMITVYAQHGYFEKAFHVFLHMKEQSLKLDNVSLIAILDACADWACCKQGRLIHEHIIPSDAISNQEVGNALLNMYGKCGSLSDALSVFNKMHQKDVYSWSTMVAAYGQHGDGKEALKLFEQMQRQNIVPSVISFVSILSSCGHAGMIHESFYCFLCMGQEWGFSPTIEHYCCMVDVLGRAGWLEEARDFTTKMPIQPDETLWTTLFNSCRAHFDV